MIIYIENGFVLNCMNNKNKVYIYVYIGNKVYIISISTTSDWLNNEGNCVRSEDNTADIGACIQPI